jgi:hypothetical protein
MPESAGQQARIQTWSLSLTSLEANLGGRHHPACLHPSVLLSVSHTGTHKPRFTNPLTLAPKHERCHCTQAFPLRCRPGHSHPHKHEHPHTAHTDPLAQTCKHTGFSLSFLAFNLVAFLSHEIVGQCSATPHRTTSLSLLWTGPAQPLGGSRVPRCRADQLGTYLKWGHELLPSCLHFFGLQPPFLSLPPPLTP